MEPQLEDKLLDQTLRPSSFSDFVGQEKTKENLKIMIQAAKTRKDPLEHILIYGPSGLGKTTLAHIIAKENQGNIKITSGAALEKAGDIAAILTNLQDGDIFFIDEVHRLNKMIEEVLYPAMESFKLDIIIGKGASAKTIQINLPHFTLIAATTRIALLSSPFRSRFGGHYRLDFYNQENIEKIIGRSAKILSIRIENEAQNMLAKASRYTPRIANKLLKRARDFAQVKGEKIITPRVMTETLKMLDIDELGLETTDRKILQTIISNFNGGPVGIKTIAASIAEEEETIEDVFEPYLMQIGFLARTPKGRIATRLAFDHLGIKNQPEII
ncbi:MAG: Holliday junction DNA helicase RuvB [Parcubacteria group bacterium RIFCSPLOWO2_01_FULL_40_65]|nr:MAG: Holliday junction DNA helicase RuvB [Parcubacteria group bacterium RIFCSPHIGHO2_01_FULL_40_30]OHB19385.1 MAG: Holliday junction DNA helicase RuvB [Parcubacteria group bacterium RIFCSPHIGHO2_02_FULL_40_12]OHB21264.1 MAG: Holliday junction DNA helicase RuvB [Parcubacteria group bacterium RIFCSPLOWO2_01_FULL_40_65]OHB23566.1 MAG: Holliday junction DNA helicase RuvB [Parcubacteria group bacterium RIFCSPLOWO2_02_FULL_40_12]OHB24339.1 MAG: Holliday junction DNA helicase RuvB [Parcubacteria gr